jgi:Spy/CpxP family protein refolding chaperone
MRRAIALAAALAAAAPAGAEAPGGGPRPDPIAARLYPPELVMSHQRELGIDDRQRDAIIEQIEKAQSQIVKLQWQMQAASEQLVKLLDAPRVDEAPALAQAERVMSLERDLKKVHLALLIRIRNVLTDAQRARLAELRRAAPER